MLLGFNHPDRLLERSAAGSRPLPIAGSAPAHGNCLIRIRKKQQAQIRALLYRLSLQRDDQIRQLSQTVLEQQAQIRAVQAEVEGLKKAVTSDERIGAATERERG